MAGRPPTCYRDVNKKGCRHPCRMRDGTLADERESACGVGRLNSTGRLVARFGALCIAGLLSAAVSQAAPIPASTTATSADSVAVIQARRDLLFKRMLANPADLDAAFEYATLSAQAGDLEAAVSTLERMLIFSPGLPRIQLELGALYFRLGAFEISRGYFVEATAGPDVPPEVRERVTVFLSAIERANKRHFWSTRVFSGVKWESNANAGPSSGDVNLRGITFTLEDSATANADHSLVLSANTHYAYVLGKQGDRIEADLLLYSSSHEEQKQVDLQVAEMTLGPSFSLKRFGLGDAILATYGIANLILLGEDPYFYTGGAGVRLAARPTAGTRLDIKSEVRRQWYETSEERPNATDRDGDEYRKFGRSGLAGRELAAALRRRHVQRSRRRGRMARPDRVRRLWRGRARSRLAVRRVAVDPQHGRRLHLARL
jgi:tetratricopeptide (TPR) repeat protein